MPFGTVSGHRLVAAQIISILTIPGWSDYIHPHRSVGIDDFFLPLSDQSVGQWMYKAEEKIRTQVNGLKSLQTINIERHPANRNHVIVDIVFTTIEEPNIHTLSFDYTSYIGADFTDKQAFMDSINLDGERFIGL